MAASRQREIGTWSASRDPAVSAKGASGSGRGPPPVGGRGACDQGEGCHRLARRQQDPGAGDATNQRARSQHSGTGGPPAGDDPISGEREGRHFPVQGAPPFSASPSTCRSEARHFSDLRIPLLENDLSRQRIGLAAKRGSLAQDWCCPSRGSGAVSPLLSRSPIREAVRRLPSAGAPLAPVASPC